MLIGYFLIFVRTLNAEPISNYVTDYENTGNLQTVYPAYNVIIIFVCPWKETQGSPDIRQELHDGKG